MSGGKNGTENDWVLNWGAQAAECENLFQNIVFFCMLSCQNTASTSVFGWFALGAGSHTSEENTGIHDTLKAPCRKKIAEKKTWFSTQSPKKTVNSDVVYGFCN